MRATEGASHPQQTIAAPKNEIVRSADLQLFGLVIMIPIVVKCP
jgi:hypothetical protein